MKPVIAKKSKTAIKTEVSTKTDAIKKSDVTTNPEPDVRVIKSGVCPSLSGRSRLSFSVGCTASNDLQLRIVGNSGTGSFRQEWVELRAIKAALDKASRDETVTSDCLVPLFRQESANMPGFVWSVLLHEGLVKCSPKQKRRYERVNPEAFDATLKALMEGKGAPTATDGKGTKSKVKTVHAAKSKNDKKSSKPS